MAIAKKLYGLVNDRDFWQKLDLTFKLNSLAWLLSSDGKAFLFRERKKQDLELKKNNRHNLEEKKIGEDKKITHKPKSVLEFLK